jgi:hypothetical protein
MEYCFNPMIHSESVTPLISISIAPPVASISAACRDFSDLNITSDGDASPRHRRFRKSEPRKATSKLESDSRIPDFAHARGRVSLIEVIDQD